MSRGKFLQRVKTNAGWLYAAEFLPRVGSLFIVPIWSVRVAPADYARWILTLTAAELLLQLGGLGFGTFLTKVIYRYRDERAERYFGMGAVVMLGATALWGLAIAMSSRWLSPLMVGAGVRADLCVFLGVYLVCAQVTNIAILYLGSSVQYARYCLLLSCRWVFNTGLFLFFLLFKGQGFYSWVWAAVGTEVLLLPVCAFQLRPVWSQWGNRRRMLRFSFRFSLPSLWTDLVAWGQGRIGRYVLSFSGLGAGLGLYGMADRFAQNYAGLIRPTKVVTLRLLGHRLEDDADSPDFLKFFHLFACLALALAFLTALFLGDVAKLFMAPGYHGSVAALPPLIFGLYLVETYSLYDTLMFRYFKVWFHFYGMVVAFVAITVTTIVLVPVMGFLGAAVANLIGAVAMMIFAHRYVVRVSPRPFRLMEKMGFAVLAFALALAADRGQWTIATKAVVALAALAPYSFYYWRHRAIFFPSMSGAAVVGFSS